MGEENKIKEQKQGCSCFSVFAVFLFFLFALAPICGALYYAEYTSALLRDSETDRFPLRQSFCFTNELMQDVIHMGFTLQRFNSGEPLSLDDLKGEKKFLSGSIFIDENGNIRNYALRETRIRLDDYSYAKRGSTKAPQHIKWNDNMYFVYSRTVVPCVPDRDLEEMNAISLACVIFGIVLWLLLRAVKSPLSIPVAVAIGFIMIAGIFNSSLGMGRYVIWNTVKDGDARLNFTPEDKEKLSAALASSTTTQIAPFEFNGGWKNDAFFARSDLFSTPYARTNLDICNYVFFVPEGAPEGFLRKLNPYLSYRPLGNGFFLGRYQNYIDIIDNYKRQGKIWASVWAVVLLIFIGLEVYFRRREKTETCLPTGP